jgi:choline dehydrogenase-like flavoprotein
VEFRKLYGPTLVNCFAHIYCYPVVIVANNVVLFPERAQKGALGWSYTDVLPYFRRLETWTEGDSEARGGSGPIGVEWARKFDPIYDAWIEAAKAAGYRETHDNSAGRPGIACQLHSQRPPLSASTHLKPALERKTSPSRRRYSRILLDGARHWHRIVNGIAPRHAGREVILSAARSTPQLLGSQDWSCRSFARDRITPLVDLRSVELRTLGHYVDVCP